MPRVMWKSRQLLFLGRIARIDLTKCPNQLLAPTCSGKRSRGCLLRTIRDSFKCGLKSLLDSVDPRGCLKDWHSFARDEETQTKMVKDRIRDESVNFDRTDKEMPNDSDNQHTNANNVSTNSSPRRRASSAQERCKVSLNRVAPKNLGKRQGLRMLSCDSDDNPKEIRQKHGILARK